MIVCDVMTSEFGVELKRRRKTARMSLDELAESATISKTYLANIENNKPHPISGALPNPKRDVVTRIAIALDWKLADALPLAGYAAPQELLQKFPHAHSISNGEDVLASRVGGEVIPASKMERARKMIEDGQKSINDGLRLLEQAKEELEEG